MTLRAPPDAKRSLQKIVAGERQLQNVHPPLRSKEQVRQAAREFAAWRRQQIAEQQQIQPIDPTPERIAKEGHGMASVAISQGARGQPLKAHKAKSPVSQYAGQWGDYAERAFVMFIRDAEVLDSVRMTVDLNATGGGSALNRLGGLGSVDDSRRDALERFLFVSDRLPEKFQKVANWLVLEVRSENSGRTVSWVDAGHLLFPSIRDKATARGISIGALLMTGELIAYWYKRWAVLSRADDGMIEAPRFKVIAEDR